MPSTTKPMLIPIAGPYRSGTGDDPDLIASNLPVFLTLDEISAREVNQ
jgi:hypothetical protein